MHGAPLHARVYLSCIVLCRSRRKMHGPNKKWIFVPYSVKREKKKNALTHCIRNRLQIHFVFVVFFVVVGSLWPSFYWKLAPRLSNPVAMFFCHLFADFHFSRLNRPRAMNVRMQLTMIAPNNNQRERKGRERRNLRHSMWVQTHKWKSFVRCATGVGAAMTAITIEMIFFYLIC